MKTMTPQIAALYIGCKVLTRVRRETEQGQPMKKLTGILREVDLHYANEVGVLLDDETDKTNYENLSLSSIKLILRPLSSISKDELKEYFMLTGELTSDMEITDSVVHEGSSVEITYRWKDEDDSMNNDDGFSYCQTAIGINNNARKNPRQFLWLLSKGFDLFNLIDNNLATTN